MQPESSASRRGSCISVDLGCPSRQAEHRNVTVALSQKTPRPFRAPLAVKYFGRKAGWKEASKYHPPPQPSPSPSSFPQSVRKGRKTPRRLPGPPAAARDAPLGCRRGCARRSRSQKRRHHREANAFRRALICLPKNAPCISMRTAPEKQPLVHARARPRTHTHTHTLAPSAAAPVWHRAARQSRAPEPPGRAGRPSP